MKCAFEGCTREVKPPRKKYCSRRCVNKAYYAANYKSDGMRNTGTLGLKVAKHQWQPGTLQA